MNVTSEYVNTFNIKISYKYIIPYFISKKKYKG